ncbi:hypothetical protein QQ045_014669 [Rhodiola kirilowii]
MNTSSSDFSSGCESGWTQYFVQSSSSKSRRTGSKKMMHNKGYGGGGEEDMSMVSDASSGPRQYNEEDEDFNRNEYSSYRNNEQKINKNGKQRDRSQTADTASSHSKNKQPSMYYSSTSYVQENSGASLSKAKPTRKKYFGS